MEFSRQEYWSGLPFPSPGTILCWFLPNANISHRYTYVPSLLNLPSTLSPSVVSFEMPISMSLVWTCNTTGNIVAARQMDLCLFSAWRSQSPFFLAHGRPLPGRDEPAPGFSAGGPQGPGCKNGSPFTESRFCPHFCYLLRLELAVTLSCK